MYHNALMQLRDTKAFKKVITLANDLKLAGPWKSMSTHLLYFILLDGECTQA
jgi:hypothetical protein